MKRRCSLHKGGAHPATSSTAPAHQLLGSANAETTPAGAPAAAADRTQRRDATCEGKTVTVQGPVKEQQPDGMSHRGLPRAYGPVQNVTCEGCVLPWACALPSMSHGICAPIVNKDQNLSPKFCTPDLTVLSIYCSVTWQPGGLEQGRGAPTQRPRNTYPLTRWHSRELLESRIGAVQCYDGPPK